LAKSYTCFQARNNQAWHPRRAYSGRAAAYVDRILRGEKPADLPVQAPTIRARDQPQDGKALGLTVPPALLARADEVIE
jgi:putative ABC transport system substrate-binding protein